MISTFKPDGSVDHALFRVITRNHFHVGLYAVAAPAMGLRGSSPSSLCCSPSRIFV